MKDLALVAGGIAGYELATRTRRWLQRRRARQDAADAKAFGDWYVQTHKDPR